jgi:hypothetical protein
VRFDLCCEASQYLFHPQHNDQGGAINLRRSSSDEAHRNSRRSLRITSVSSGCMVTSAPSTLPHDPRRQGTTLFFLDLHRDLHGLAALLNQHGQTASENPTKQVHRIDLVFPDMTKRGCINPALVRSHRPLDRPAPVGGRRSIRITSAATSMPMATSATRETFMSHPAALSNRLRNHHSKALGMHQSLRNCLPFRHPCRLRLQPHGARFHDSRPVFRHRWGHGAGNRFGCPGN